MSRTDDFAKAGQALAKTKRTSEAQAQCRYDFGIAAEHGYQYAVEKACEWLDNNAYLYVDDIDKLHESALIGDFRKAFEELKEL